MECPGEWKLFEGHCYLLVKKYVNWTEGEKDCKNKGGHLASIHSAAENNFVSNLPPSKSLWIGGTDAAVEVGFLAYSFPSCLDRTYLKVFLIWPGSNKVKSRFSSFGAAGECAKH
ncbi:MAG: C-type lectin domain-containing protein, partial [bacterium]